MEGDRAFTWSALLAHYTRLAQAAVALPEDAEGERWRRAVTPLITLHAITKALGELGLLPAEERAAGIDRAGVQVRTQSRELHELWRGEPLPGEVRSLIDEAHAALARARTGGLEWTVAAERLVAEHPGELAVAIASTGFAGDLFLPWPGVALFEGAPAGFMRDGSGGAIEPELLEVVGEFLGEGAQGPAERARFRQVYRQFDFAEGRAVRDLVVDEDALGSGQPLLVAAIAGGEVQAVPLPPRQAEAMMEPLPVVVEEEEDAGA